MGHELLLLEGGEQGADCGIAWRVGEFLQYLVGGAFSFAEKDVHHLALATCELAVLELFHGRKILNAGKTANKIDSPDIKCCFSSIMKMKTAIVSGAALVALVISSCSPMGVAPRVGAPALSQANDGEVLKSQERPGLATGWGDEKASRLSYTQFVRASSKPAGTDVIFYNNPEGVEAMTNSKRKVGPLQTAAGQMVEWGLKGGSGYLPTYKEYGYGRRLVEGKNGSEYTIVVKNRCKSALEIVASVDGLDVHDGKTASFSKRGYIIEPGETLEIDGFRTSDRSVAAFEFSSVSNSYANLKHGDTRNVGVVGIAVFTQKGVNPWRWTSAEVERRKGASAFAEAP